MASLAIGLNVSRSGGMSRKIRDFQRRSVGAQDRINDAAHRGIVMRCPVSTEAHQHMRSTIVQIRTPGASYTRVNAFYGWYVNFGTRNMAPQPFFTQGVRIEGIAQLKKEARTLWS